MSTTADSPRLFAPFLDATDMVMCCSADTPLAEIAAQAVRHKLRFPLVCDSSASLRDHVATVEYAPGSARFGPYVDNILGMNWELKSGTMVRIGERVIKSTTGYDLMRFLLHSDGRYGRASDYVIRLRPLGGETARVIFRGDATVIDRARAAVLKSPWIHWLDGVDLHVDTDDGTALELVADCAPGESEIFAGFFAQLGRECGTVVLAGVERRRALPALSVKTTVTEAPKLARKLVRDHGGRARALCVNGVVYYFPPAELSSLPEAALTDLTRHCSTEGGHVSGPWAKPLPSDPREAVWAAEFEATWNQL